MIASTQGWQNGCPDAKGQDLLICGLGTFYLP
jgi:hypothetical protein